MNDSPIGWWRLAFVSALILVLALSGLLWLRRSPPAPRVCPAPPPVQALRLPPTQLETPVLLAGTQGVTLAVDGSRAPADGLARLAPGKHRLLAEAPGFPPHALEFRLEAFQPALFEVEPSGKYLSVVYLGAACAGCATGQPQPLHPQEPATAPFDELETQAAEALQRQDWLKAASFLEQVQPHERELPRFKRLAEAVLQSSGAHAEARAQLLVLTGSKALDQVLAHYEDLARSESEREHQHWLTRWNALTEIYQRLLRLEDDAPQLLDASSAKLAKASAAFLRASKEHSAQGEREAAEEGEQVVLELVQRLRAFRPTDCELQAKVTAAL